MNYVNYIRLKITKSEDDLLKVVWGNSDSDFPPYQIYRKQFEETASNCREQLLNLVREYEQEVSPNYNPILKKLAEKGALLYFSLFGGAHPKSRNIAKSVEAWLQKLSEDNVILTISSDASCHIPWGLVFDRNDMKNLTDEAQSIDEFNGFWAIKYNVSTLYNGMVLSEINEARKRESFKIIAGLNKKIFIDAKKKLCESEKDLLSSLITKPAGRAFNSDTCKQKWQEVGHHECLIYFYCHASGGELELSDDDRISVVDFRAMFQRDFKFSDPSYSLIFLNGCSTADGVLDNGFITAGAEPGFCGFVGSETELPDDFALRFGLAFLYLLLDKGLTLGEIIDQLRRQHWPLGLLYGCYAHRDFHIQADSIETEPSCIKDCNYSLDKFK